MRYLKWWYNGMRYSAILMLIIGTAVVSAACFLYSADVQFGFDNRTDSTLCLFPSPEDAATGRCLNGLKPEDYDRKRTVGCGDGPHADSALVSVVITVDPRGHEIYSRTEECRLWNDSDRRFIIEQRGDDFVVTDPLPEEGR
jgi:hypothetical protein